MATRMKIHRKSNSRNQKFVEVAFHNWIYKNFWLPESKSNQILIVMAKSSWKLMFYINISGTYGRQNENSEEIEFLQPKVPESWQSDSDFQEILAFRIKIQS